MSTQGAVPLAFLQQQKARPIDPEELEMMGKRAAALYRDSGLDLSNAVVEIVKEARLAPEQVKRVCEFANTTAYLDEFEKAGSVRNVTFEGGPADPGRILRDLNDGSSPAIQHVESSDYATPVGSYKTAGKSMSKIAAAFGVPEGSMEKTAEAVNHHSLHANPVEDVYDLKLALEATRQDLLSKLATSGVIYGDVSNDLCSAVVEEVRSGTSLGDVARACASFTDDVPLHKQAMVVIGEYLRDTKVMSPGALGDSLRKVASAGVIPDPKHPVIERFVAFTKVADGHRRLQMGVNVVDEELSKVNQKLKELL